MNSPAIRKMTKITCAAFTHNIVTPRNPVQSAIPLLASHAPDQMFDMGYGRVGHDTMAEIEDMGPFGESCKDAIDRSVKSRAAGDQRERIKIALHR